MTPPSPNPSIASGTLMHCYFSASILLEAYRNLPVTVAEYTIEADRIYLKPTSWGDKIHMEHCRHISSQGVDMLLSTYIFVEAKFYSMYQGMETKLILDRFSRRNGSAQCIHLIVNMHIYSNIDSNNVNSLITHNPWNNIFKLSPHPQMLSIGWCYIW